MPETASASDTIRLRAALIALALLVLAGVALLPWVRGINARHADEMLIKAFPAKNQGEWLQREAFMRDGLLPVIGTSELVVDVPNRASEFFADSPTGFQICPVGGPGNTTIVMAEKVAALGERLRGRKLVIILSSSWFTKPGVMPDNYAGNFSVLHAIRLLENDALDPALRLRFTKRMSEFPATLAEHPVLRTYLESKADEGAGSKFLRAVSRPVLDGERIKLCIEDQFATASFAGELKQDEASVKKLRTIDWAAQIDAAEKSDAAADNTWSARDYVSTDGGRDDVFVAMVDASREWDDLALLLDTLRHFEANVLVLATPLDGMHYDKHAISRGGRNYYYRRLNAECAARAFFCEPFSNHDYDPGFLLPNTSHFTAKGWLYVNQVLDDFWHDRLHRPQPEPGDIR